MKFRLEIELGDGHDQPLTLIGSTLRDVAQTVQSQGILFAQTRAIADHNGKNVGEWEIAEDAPSPAPAMYQITGDNEQVVTISVTDAPELDSLFRAWQAAPERSSLEQLAWEAVISAASRFLDEGAEAENVDLV